MRRAFFNCSVGCVLGSLSLTASAQVSESVLDASQCRGTPAGEDLLRALAMEGAWTNGPPPDEEFPRDFVLGVRVVNCEYNDESLVIEVRESDVSGSRHILDLSAVPEVVRARTAAVALVEWARSLSPAGTMAPKAPIPKAEPPAKPATAPADTTGPSAGRAATASFESSGRQAPRRHLRPWVVSGGLGFELTHAPTPASLRIDAVLDRRLFGGVRASIGLFAAYLTPQSHQGRLRAWWWGAELALGHAWGDRAQFGLFGLTSVDCVTVSGVTRDESETSRVTQPLVSLSVRAQMRKFYENGLTLGVAIDGGGFVQGARFTALGESIAQFEGIRLGSRALIGYSF